MTRSKTNPNALAREKNKIKPHKVEKKEPIVSMDKNEIISCADSFVLTLNKTQAESEKPVQPTPKENILKPVNPDNPILEFIEMREGNNSIRIQLSKNGNRSYRIQIYLNDMEIRPSTFMGSSPALSYWELLRRILK